MFFAIISDLEKYMLPCVNKRMFGFECPGCGLQRAVSLVMQGDFLEAFYMYPAIYNLFALGIFFGLRIFVKWKYDNFILKVLMFSTIGLIIGSFIWKLIN